jgi:AcrR family transcriptional regulator
MIEPERLNKRSLQALESKKRIFNSAIDLFNEFGFENVTINNICRKAGVSTGLFYNYFDSKDQIIVEVFKNMDLNGKEAFYALPENLSAPEKLLIMAEYGAIHSLEKDFLRIVYRRFLTQAKEDVYMLDEDRRFLYKFYNEVIEEGQRNGQITSELDVKEIQFTILTVIRGVLFQWALYEGSFDLVSEMKKTVSVLINGLRTTPNANNSQAETQL